MKPIEYEEVKLLKRSEKSTVFLMREPDGERLFVQKALEGRHPVYAELLDSPHPYLPKLYEARISDDETTVIEEYIEGRTLGSVSLSEAQIRKAVKELCAVLEFLHGKGIIHRDVKPSNIILAGDGHIRLIDFDAARMIKEGVEQDTALLGTRGYAPPEQYGFSQTDARADVYALGMTLEQLLGGKAGKARYRRVIRTCTDLNPDKRYQSAREVRAALSPAKRVAVCCVVAILLAVVLCYAVLRPQPLLSGANGNGEDAVSAFERTWIQAEYPDEDLLFYAIDSDYITWFEPDHATAEPAILTVDMTGEGNFVDFCLPYSLSDWVAYGEPFDLGVYIDPLSDGIQPSFWNGGDEVSLWNNGLEDFMRAIPYPATNLIGAPPMTQITCVDADSDGIRELFVSKGNREHTVITTVWRLSDIPSKSFEYVGVLWGTSTMNLYSNGDVRAFVNSNQLNRYNYSGGELSVLSEIDFEEFKAAQEAAA